ncbi:MAG: aminotransferase class V-fold PLP-dependent enzyme [Actinomycetia bacterium]|nr:aminotransferase class V-fold PLP-dependent enzyme [Actinomycetes bacterium]
MTDLTRMWAEQQDVDDELAVFGSRVYRPDPDLLYLDGNSLGMLPIATRDRLRRLVDEEWGRDLVRGWQHWESLPVDVGDRIGSLIGAAPGQVIACDSVSVNLYKLAVAALEAQPGRKVLVTDSGNFPSDRYVLQGAAERRKGQLRLVPTDPFAGINPDSVSTYLADDVAMVAFSHVDYRSAAINDVVTLTEQAHQAGALVLWDLAHSIGSVPIDLDSIGVDFAVGCTYKYLNAGPGSPAFLYVRRDLQERLANPIQGWWSAADPFDMDAPYTPANGIGRWQTGSPPILGLVAADEGAALLAEAGMVRLRAKSMRLTEYLIMLSDSWLVPLGFGVASTREPELRGGHVVLAHDEAYRISRVAAAAGVVGDARPPNLLRLAPAPLTTSFTDVWEAMVRLRDLVASGAHLTVPAERDRVT